MNDTFDTHTGALILVIDDEVTQRLLTRDCLESAGFRVEEAADGNEGLERIRALRPDLVLLDVMMPGMDGFEVCRSLRENPDIRFTPVIIVTGREDIEDINRGFAAGASDFLTKPLTWNLLPSRVNFVLRTNRLENELRRSMEAAKRADRAKSNLLATMGHELRTPLNAIIGFSALIKEAPYGPLGSAKYGEFAADIHDSGARLLSAINHILEIVNCDTDALQVDAAPFAIACLLDTAVREQNDAATERDVIIRNDGADPGLLIRADSVLLRRALSCIISNAIKFSHPGGVVGVAAEGGADGGLAITIDDQGIGIPPEELSRVMKPFEQLDNTLSRKYEGLGLGIPLARAIMRQHGGDMVYDTAPGRGTHVTMTLPAGCVVNGADARPDRSEERGPDNASAHGFQNHTPRQAQKKETG